MDARLKVQLFKRFAAVMSLFFLGLALLSVLVLVDQFNLVALSTTVCNLMIAAAAFDVALHTEVPKRQFDLEGEDLREL